MLRWFCYFAEDEGNCWAVQSTWTLVSGRKPTAGTLQILGYGGGGTKPSIAKQSPLSKLCSSLGLKASIGEDLWFLGTISTVKMLWFCFGSTEDQLRFWKNVLWILIVIILFFWSLSAWIIAYSMTEILSIHNSKRRVPIVILKA